MRSSVLSVFAGVAAALCFASIFISLVVGQFLFPLASLPLFLVLLIVPANKTWPMLLGSTLAFAGLFATGALGAHFWLTVLSFVAIALVPAYFVTKLYVQPLQYDDDGEPILFLPAELPIICLCFLSLILFYTTYAFADQLFGKELYPLIYDYALNLVYEVQEQLKAIDSPLVADPFYPQGLARASTINIASAGIFIFILGHFANLIFAQWVMRKLYLTEHPLPKMSNLYFPHLFLLLFVFVASAYTYANMVNFPNSLIFALTPPMIAFGLPLAIQGLSAAHRFLVKNLVKVGLISVYLGLILGLMIMPFQIGGLLLLLGISNNALVYVKNRARRSKTDEN